MHILLHLPLTRKLANSRLSNLKSAQPCYTILNPADLVLTTVGIQAFDLGFYPVAFLSHSLNGWGSSCFCQLCILISSEKIYMSLDVSPKRMAWFWLLMTWQRLLCLQIRTICLQVCK